MTSPYFALRFSDSISPLLKNLLAHSGSKKTKYFQKKETRVSVEEKIRRQSF
jgi:hypothetical protein